jgi:septal ring factor EnvC (AmiA/AmiB activator)
MSIDANSVIIVIVASILSGMGTAMINGIKESKKEKNRQIEREQDMLKMELKDLEIKLYKLEKDLAEWRDKYYAAVQELIEVKSELENCLIELNHIVHHED